MEMLVSCRRRDSSAPGNVGANQLRKMIEAIEKERLA